MCPVFHLLLHYYARCLYAKTVRLYACVQSHAKFALMHVASYLMLPNFHNCRPQFYQLLMEVLVDAACSTPFAPSPAIPDAFQNAEASSGVRISHSGLYSVFS